jgi:hypothetical protein
MTKYSQKSLVYFSRLYLLALNFSSRRVRKQTDKPNKFKFTLRVLQVKKCPIVIANAALAKPLQELRNVRPWRSRRVATARYWDCFSSLREAAPTRRYANAMTDFGSFICWNTLTSDRLMHYRKLIVSTGTRKTNS